MAMSLEQLRVETAKLAMDLPDEITITMENVEKFSIDPDIEEIIRFALSDECRFVTFTRS